MLLIDRLFSAEISCRIPTTGTLPERLASAVLQHFPYAYCFACLATRLDTIEPLLRDAAQLLIIRDGFRVTRRVCYGCSRTDDLLVNEKLRSE
jgi:hypothetical protein